MFLLIYSQEVIIIKLALILVSRSAFLARDCNSVVDGYVCNSDYKISVWIFEEHDDIVKDIYFVWHKAITCVYKLLVQFAIQLQWIINNIVCILYYVKLYATLILQRFAFQTYTSCHGTCTNISVRDWTDWSNLNIACTDEIILYIMCMVSSKNKFLYKKNANYVLNKNATYANMCIFFKQEMYNNVYIMYRNIILNCHCTFMKYIKLLSVMVQKCKWRCKHDNDLECYLGGDCESIHFNYTSVNLHSC